MFTDSTLRDRQPVNNMKCGSDGFRNEIMFDVTSSFSLNFGHIVRKAGRRGATLSSTELHMGEKINLNTKGEAYVLLHDI